MKKTLFLVPILALCGCLPVDVVLLPHFRRSFATGEDAHRVLKVKTVLHKGTLTHYTETVLVNRGWQNILLVECCAYYDKDGLVGREVSKTIVLPPKSKVIMYRRLFHIEQRYDWKCRYYDSDGVGHAETSVRTKD